MIRQLKPGEKLPAGEPRRYIAGHGYVRLRWKIGERQYVETYEHRVDGDHVTTAQHVHHRNRRRDDNSPTNLERLTVDEHGERHASPHADRCVELYRAGRTTVAIGRAVGLDSATVYRLLQKRGEIDPRRGRGSGYYSTPMPSDEQLRTWHAAGVRVQRMALLSKVGRLRIERRLDDLGLPRFRPGHPCHDEAHREPQKAREEGWLTYRKDLGGAA